MIDYSEDAENWGNALNEAGWVFIDQWDTKRFGLIPAGVWNNLKSMLRPTILAYINAVEKDIRAKKASDVPLDS